LGAFSDDGVEGFCFEADRPEVAAGDAEDDPLLPAALFDALVCAERDGGEASARAAPGPAVSPSKASAQASTTRRRTGPGTAVLSTFSLASPGGTVRREVWSSYRRRVARG
jgi:hypothetical protein